MAIQDRRAREYAKRYQLIIATARRLAESEGWDAVTTRRLAAEIEYSQPVLYKHFGCMDEIVQAVAVEGFAELADTLRAARSGAPDPEQALHRIAHAFSDFAGANQAVYDAMFIRATDLPFGTDETPPDLVAAFTEIRDAIADATPEAEADTLAEVFWGALHGLAMLTRSGRLRPAQHDERIDLLVGRFLLAEVTASGR